MLSDFQTLPILDILGEIKKQLLLHQSLVLCAEPGSGKTTIVPLALLEEPWLQGKKIIILEPRRIAARMAAKRMSVIADTTLGGLVGFSIRFEQKISADTRIEVVTEGVFLHRIQNDPELADIGLVIFDEFHERSMQSDLGLAFCLDMLDLRTDLKLMIMSATMDSTRITELLRNAPIVTGKGSCFPVAVRYLPRPSSDYPVPCAIKAIRHSLANDQGDILVFLPGGAEIRSVTKHFRSEPDLCILPLYGDLPQHKQDMVFIPTRERKLILATPIAETSITIEGVSVVIDSGLMKKPVFSPANGLSSLRTVSVSRASARQRAGRAGRLGPGICYRLWTQDEHFSRADYSIPEILEADLSPLLLEMLQWGVNNPDALQWLDPPRKGQIQQATDMLRQLGALHHSGSLSTLGQKIAKLPAHPRLALLLIRAKEHNLAGLACRLVALLQNRDILRERSGERSVDIELRLETLHLFEQGKQHHLRTKGADISHCRRIMREVSQYLRLLKTSSTIDTRNFQEAGNLLAYAYPDRICWKKPKSSQHLLSSGRGVQLPADDPLRRANFLVAANMDGGKKQGRIFLAAEVLLEDLKRRHKQLFSRKKITHWIGNKVEAVEILTLGNLQVEKKRLVNPDPTALQDCFLEAIQKMGSSCLNWQQKSRDLQARLQTAHTLSPDQWPNVSDTFLFQDFTWLLPFLDGISSLKQLRRIDLSPVLLSLLSWKKQQILEISLPTHFQAPSGSRIKLQYQPGESPVLAVHLQEMFGTTETPTLFGGRLPVLIHLLSPASRPVQVTADLASFWKNTYPQVKKELAGRYPKHFWPDDPFIAKATVCCKPRSQTHTQLTF